MRPIKNFDTVNASGSRERLKPGGYVVRITAVKDNEKKECLELLFDITEGPAAGYYSDVFFDDKPYAHRLFRSYKEAALGMFKRFTEAVDASNGTHFTEQVKTGLKEDQLVGKVLGIVLAEEEYINNRGEVARRLYDDVRQDMPAEKIRAGEYVVPDIKKYKPKEESAAPVAPDQPQETGIIPDPDIPF